MVVIAGFKLHPDGATVNRRTCIDAFMRYRDDISALLCHWRKGYLDVPTWKAAVPVAVPAALAGAWIATAVDVDLLRRPFGIYLLLSGLSLIFPQKDHKTPGG